ncbi:MAG TPA: VIT domain-containing protein [Xanthomonadales bacterium]|nr:VIT domain-containing protein [Xanthomonadales bacterium]
MHQAHHDSPASQDHPAFPGQSQFPSVNPSIRHQLEMDAWRRHPAFARRMAERKLAERRPRRKLRWQDRTLLTVGLVLLTLVLIRIETAAAGDPQWGLELDTGQQVHTRLAMHTQIEAEVTGLAARVEVTQLFVNDSADWAEGVYRFPLPAGAAVDRLRVQAGERIIVGEIQEKHTAERVYQQAKADGQVASLVSRQRPNQFETRLANIAPGEEISVTIGFLMNVDLNAGSFSLRLPMTFTPRWDDPAKEPAAPQPTLVSAGSRPDHGLDLEVFIHSGIGFAAIESQYHDVDITPTAQGYRVRLVDPAARPDRDFELSWFPDLQAVPQSALMTWDGGDAVYAQLMMVPPLAEAVSLQPRDVVFIIDTSGSMEGQSIEQAKSALRKGLAELRDADYFNVLQFNSKTELLFSESVPVTRANLALANDYIGALVANGGTVMAPALRAAFTLPPQHRLLRQVIFVTDGSVGNGSELLSAVAEQLGASRLFTISIGSAPNSGFMRKAAEIGRGSHTHIGKLEEVETGMTRLWSHIRTPALSDICVDWGPDAEFYPEIIPDLYAGEPLWIVARLPLEPREITICGQLDGQPWEQTSRPKAGGGNDTLATLWARKKIEALEDGMLFGADAAQSREQILDVALDFGLLTAQTSLVAVDRTPVRLPDEALATGHVPGLLPAGSSTTFAGFPQTAAGWQLQLILSALSLLIVCWLYWASAVPPGRPISRSPLGTSADAAT